MAKCARNMLIFPNLVINDIMSITVRVFQPVAPDYMDVSVWSLAPLEEIGKPALSRRLTNFLEFLGPGGFATPGRHRSAGILPARRRRRARGAMERPVEGLRRQRRRQSG